MKKGFTLIELLAVIVVLGLLAVIIIPVAGKIIDNSKYKVAEQSVMGYVNAANAKATQNILNSNGLIVDEEKYIYQTEVDDDVLSGINVSGSVPTFVYLEYNPTTKVVVQGRFCMNDYSIRYERGITHRENYNYCGDVDLIAPTIEGILNGRVASLSLSDNKSGIASYCMNTIDDKFSCDWISTNLNNFDYTFAVPGTYYAFAKDNASNISNGIEFILPLSAFNYDATVSTYAATQAITTYAASVVTETSSMSHSREGCGHCYINGHYEGYLYCEQQGVAVDTSCGCASGWNEVSGHCEKKSYSCNSGDTRSGTTCTHNAGYTCNAGDILDNQTCYHYECTEGGTLNGTICER